MIELESIFDVYIEDLLTKEVKIKLRLLKKDVGKTKFVVQGRSVKRTYVKKQTVIKGKMYKMNKILRW